MGHGSDPRASAANPTAFAFPALLQAPAPGSERPGSCAAASESSERLPGKGLMEGPTRGWTGSKVVAWGFLALTVLTPELLEGFKLLDLHLGPSLHAFVK